MPIVSTGDFTIVDTNDAVAIALTQASVIIATDAQGLGGSFESAVTTATVVLGATNVSSDWLFSAVASAGVTGTLLGQTYTVSALSATVGFVDITATRQGQSDLTARFNITKVRQGQTGTSLVLVPSASGFTFTDGVALPATQRISIRALRQSSIVPVSWFASNGAQLDIDTGFWTTEGVVFGLPSTGEGDTCYLDLATFGDSAEMHITAISGDSTSVLQLTRINYSTADAGATRNVFRGPWTSGLNYIVGDNVTLLNVGWSCRVLHTASGGNAPPVFPSTSNTWWERSAVQGVRGTIQAAVVTTGSVWSDSEATIAIEAAGGISPITGDVVTLYNTASEFSQTRVRGATTWDVLAAFFGGNVLVDGTVTASKLAVTTLSAITADLGTVTAGIVRSSNFVAGTSGSEINLTTGAAELNSLIVRESMLGNGSVTNSKIATGAVTRGNIAGSAAVTNNSATWTTLAEFTMISLPVVSFVQGYATLRWSQSPSAFGSTFRMRVTVAGTEVANIPQASLLNDGNLGLYIVTFVAPSVAAGDVAVVLQIQNGGGQGVNSSQLFAQAVMR